MSPDPDWAEQIRRLRIIQKEAPEIGRMLATDIFEDYFTREVLRDSTLGLMLKIGAFRVDRMNPDEHALEVHYRHIIWDNTLTELHHIVREARRAEVQEP